MRRDRLKLPADFVPNDMEAVLADTLNRFEQHAVATSRWIWHRTVADADRRMEAGYETLGHGDGIFREATAEAARAQEDYRNKEKIAQLAKKLLGSGLSKAQLHNSMFEFYEKTKAEHGDKAAVYLAILLSNTFHTDPLLRIEQQKLELTRENKRNIAYEKAVGLKRVHWQNLQPERFESRQSRGAVQATPMRRFFGELRNAVMDIYYDVRESLGYEIPDDVVEERIEGMDDATWVALNRANIRARENELSKMRARIITNAFAAYNRSKSRVNGNILTWINVVARRRTEQPKHFVKVFELLSWIDALRDEGQEDFLISKLGFEGNRAGYVALYKELRDQRDAYYESVNHKVDKEAEKLHRLDGSPEYVRESVINDLVGQYRDRYHQALDARERLLNQPSEHAPDQTLEQEFNALQQAETARRQATQAIDRIEQYGRNPRLREIKHKIMEAERNITIARDQLIHVYKLVTADDVEVAQQLYLAADSLTPQESIPMYQLDQDDNGNIIVPEASDDDFDEAQASLPKPLVTLDRLQNWVEGMLEANATTTYKATLASLFLNYMLDDGAQYGSGDEGSIVAQWVNRVRELRDKGNYNPYHFADVAKAVQDFSLFVTNNLLEHNLGKLVTSATSAAVEACLHEDSEIENPLIAAEQEWDFLANNFWNRWTHTVLYSQYVMNAYAKSLNEKQDSVTNFRWAKVCLYRLGVVQKVLGGRLPQAYQNIQDAMVQALKKDAQGPLVRETVIQERLQQIDAAVSGEDTFDWSGYLKATDFDAERKIKSQVERSFAFLEQQRSAYVRAMLGPDELASMTELTLKIEMTRFQLAKINMHKGGLTSRGKQFFEDYAREKTKKLRQLSAIAIKRMIQHYSPRQDRGEQLSQTQIITDISMRVVYDERSTLVAGGKPHPIMFETLGNVTLDILAEDEQQNNPLAMLQHTVPSIVEAENSRFVNPEMTPWQAFVFALQVHPPEDRSGVAKLNELLEESCDKGVSVKYVVFDNKNNRAAFYLYAGGQLIVDPSQLRGSDFSDYQGLCELLVPRIMHANAINLDIFEMLQGKEPKQLLSCIEDCYSTADTLSLTPFFYQMASQLRFYQDAIQEMLGDDHSETSYRQALRESLGWQGTLAKADELAQAIVRMARDKYNTILDASDQPEQLEALGADDFFMQQDHICYCLRRLVGPHSAIYQDYVNDQNIVGLMVALVGRKHVGDHDLGLARGTLEYDHLKRVLSIVGSANNYDQANAAQRIASISCEVADGQPRPHFLQEIFDIFDREPDLLVAFKQWIAADVGCAFSDFCVPDRWKDKPDFKKLNNFIADANALYQLKDDGVQSCSAQAYFKVFVDNHERHYELEEKRQELDQLDERYAESASLDWGIEGDPQSFTSAFATIQSQFEAQQSAVSELEERKNTLQQTVARLNNAIENPEGFWDRRDVVIRRNSEALQLNEQLLSEATQELGSQREQLDQLEAKFDDLIEQRAYYGALQETVERLEVQYEEANNNAIETLSELVSLSQDALPEVRKRDAVKYLNQLLLNEELINTTLFHDLQNDALSAAFLQWLNGEARDVAFAEAQREMPLYTFVTQMDYVLAKDENNRTRSMSTAAYFKNYFFPNVLHKFVRLDHPLWSLCEATTLQQEIKADVLEDISKVRNLFVRYVFDDSRTNDDLSGYAINSVACDSAALLDYLDWLIEQSDGVKTDIENQNPVLDTLHQIASHMMTAYDSSANNPFYKDFVLVERVLSDYAEKRCVSGKELFGTFAETYIENTLFGQEIYQEAHAAGNANRMTSWIIEYGNDSQRQQLLDFYFTQVLSVYSVPVNDDNHSEGLVFHDPDTVCEVIQGIFDKVDDQEAFVAVFKDRWITMVENVHGSASNPSENTKLKALLDKLMAKWGTLSQQVDHDVYQSGSAEENAFGSINGFIAALSAKPNVKTIDPLREMEEKLSKYDDTEDGQQKQQAYQATFLKKWSSEIIKTDLMPLKWDPIKQNDPAIDEQSKLYQRHKWLIDVAKGHVHATYYAGMTNAMSQENETFWRDRSTANCQTNAALLERKYGNLQLEKYDTTGGKDYLGAFSQINGTCLDLAKELYVSIVTGRIVTVEPYVAELALSLLNDKDGYLVNQAKSLQPDTAAKDAYQTDIEPLLLDKSYLQAVVAANKAASMASVNEMVQQIDQLKNSNDFASKANSWNELKDRIDQRKGEIAEEKAKADSLLTEIEQAKVELTQKHHEMRGLLGLAAADELIMPLYDEDKQQYYTKKRIRKTYIKDAQESKIIHDKHEEIKQARKALEKKVAKYNAIRGGKSADGEMVTGSLGLLEQEQEADYAELSKLDAYFDLMRPVVAAVSQKVIALLATGDHQKAQRLLDAVKTEAMDYRYQQFDPEKKSARYKDHSAVVSELQSMINAAAHPAEAETVAPMVVQAYREEARELRRKLVSRQQLGGSLNVSRGMMAWLMLLPKNDELRRDITVALRRILHDKVLHAYYTNSTRLDELAGQLDGQVDEYLDQIAQDVNVMKENNKQRFGTVDLDLAQFVANAYDLKTQEMTEAMDATLATLSDKLREAQEALAAKEELAEKTIAAARLDYDQTIAQTNAPIDANAAAQKEAQDQQKILDANKANDLTVVEKSILGAVFERWESAHDEWSSIKDTVQFTSQLAEIESLIKKANSTSVTDETRLHRILIRAEQLLNEVRIGRGLPAKPIDNIALNRVACERQSGSARYTRPMFSQEHDFLHLKAQCSEQPLDITGGDVKLHPVYKRLQEACQELEQARKAKIEELQAAFSEVDQRYAAQEQELEETLEALEEAASRLENQSTSATVRAAMARVTEVTDTQQAEVNQAMQLVESCEQQIDAARREAETEKEKLLIEKDNAIAWAREYMGISNAQAVLHKQARELGCVEQLNGLSTAMLEPTNYVDKLPMSLLDAMQRMHKLLNPATSANIINLEYAAPDLDGLQAYSENVNGYANSLLEDMKRAIVQQDVTLVRSRLANTFYQPCVSNDFEQYASPRELLDNAAQTRLYSLVDAAMQVVLNGVDEVNNQAVQPVERLTSTFHAETIRDAAMLYKHDGDGSFDTILREKLVGVVEQLHQDLNLQTGRLLGSEHGDFADENRTDVQRAALRQALQTNYQFLKAFAARFDLSEELREIDARINTLTEMSFMRDIVIPGGKFRFRALYSIKGDETQADAAAARRSQNSKRNHALFRFSSNTRGDIGKASRFIDFATKQASYSTPEQALLYQYDANTDGLFEKMLRLLREIKTNEYLFKHINHCAARGSITSEQHALLNMFRNFDRAQLRDLLASEELLSANKDGDVKFRSANAYRCLKTVFDLVAPGLMQKPGSKHIWERSNEGDATRARTDLIRLVNQFEACVVKSCDYVWLENADVKIGKFAEARMHEDSQMRVLLLKRNVCQQAKKLIGVENTDINYSKLVVWRLQYVERLYKIYYEERLTSHERDLIGLEIQQQARLAVRNSQQAENVYPHYTRDLERAHTNWLRRISVAIKHGALDNLHILVDGENAPLKALAAVASDVSAFEDTRQKVELAIQAQEKFYPWLKSVSAAKDAVELAEIGPYPGEATAEDYMRYLTDTQKTELSSILGGRASVSHAAVGPHTSTPLRASERLRHAVLSAAPSPIGVDDGASMDVFNRSLDELQNAFADDDTEARVDVSALIQTLNDTIAQEQGARHAALEAAASASTMTAGSTMHDGSSSGDGSLHDLNLSRRYDGSLITYANKEAALYSLAAQFSLKRLNAFLNVARAYRGSGSFSGNTFKHMHKRSGDNSNVGRLNDTMYQEICSQNMRPQAWLDATESYSNLLLLNHVKKDPSIQRKFMMAFYLQSRLQQLHELLFDDQGETRNYNELSDENLGQVYDALLQLREAVTIYNEEFTLPGHELKGFDIASSFYRQVMGPLNIHLMKQYDNINLSAINALLPDDERRTPTGERPHGRDTSPSGSRRGTASGDGSVASVRRTAGVRLTRRCRGGSGSVDPSGPGVPKLK